MAARTSDPRWKAGFEAGEQDRHARVDLGDRLDGGSPSSLAWFEGYKAARHADDPVSVAPPGWPTLLAGAAAGAWADSLQRGGRSWNDPCRALSLVVALAAGRAEARSGRARAARRGIRRQGDLPPGFGGGLHVLGATAAVTFTRLAWWRARYGRASMPDHQRTWSRCFTRRIIIAGVSRREWDRRLRALRP